VVRARPARACKPRHELAAGRLVLLVGRGAVVWVTTSVTLSGLITPGRGRATMIVLGVILLIVGLLIKISILTTIGIILLVIGLIVVLLGAVGRPLAGRRHFF